MALNQVLSDEILDIDFNNTSHWLNIGISDEEIESAHQTVSNIRENLIESITEYMHNNEMNFRFSVLHTTPSDDEMDDSPDNTFEINLYGQNYTTANNLFHYIHRTYGMHTRLGQFVQPNRRNNINISNNASILYNNGHSNNYTYYQAVEDAQTEYSDTSFDESLTL